MPQGLNAQGVNLDCFNHDEGTDKFAETSVAKYQPVL